MSTGLAHLFALPNKMALAGPDYLTAQLIYRGWALLGSIILPAILAALWMMITVRGRSEAVVAFVALVGTQVIFWIFTYPVNRITENWTRLPGNWQQLRARWEYSHAASAGLELVAVVALIWMAVSNEN